MRHKFMIFSVLALVALTLAPLSHAQENSTSYQVQIGSARSLKGTKYFAAKASRILDESAYIIHRGEYYVVLTGYCTDKEQAQNRLMEIRQHYNGMVVAYEVDDVIAAYSDGNEVSEEEMVRTVFAGERAIKEREKRLQTEPIREVTRKQSTGLRGVVEEGLFNVQMDNCRLVNTEKFAGYDFRTTANLSDLDPYTLDTEEKHGANLYLSVTAKGKLNKVVIEQFAGGKSTSSRKEEVLSLKLREADAQSVEKVATALRELMNYCASKK